MLNRFFLFFLLVFSGLNYSLNAAENSSQLYNKGAKLAKNGKIDEAIEVFKSVIVKNPYYCLGHYGLGKSYLYKKGMLNKAIKHLSISVDLDKEFSKGFFYLGLGYYFFKKYPRAITSFDRSFKLDRTIVEALYNIGVVYEIMGNSSRALYFFTKYYDLKSKLGQDRIF